MPSFHYLATGPARTTERGRIEASDRTAALAALDRKGLETKTLVSGALGSVAVVLSSDLGQSRADASALRAFSREFALLLGARIGLAAALEMLIQEGGREFAQLPLADLFRRVQSGETLADAMNAHTDIFRPDYVGIIRMGQASGTLHEAVADLAQMLERRAVYRSRLTSALTYPVILLLASAGLLAVLVQVVLPSFGPLLARSEQGLPWTTQVVLAATDWAPTIGAALASAIALAALAWWGAGQDPDQRILRDRALLRIPVVGPVLLFSALAQSLRSLGIMVASGLQLLPAIAIAREGAGNAAMAAMLHDVAVRLEQGERLSEALRRDPLMLPVVPRLVRVGEESGDLGTALSHVANLLDAKLGERLDRAIALITPVLTMVVGGVICFVMIAIMSALLGANDIVLAS